MCSVGDQGDEEFIVKDAVKFSESDSCRKCLEAKVKVVLRGKDFYCYKCFLEYFRHKFRSTIGKSKLIKPGDNVLVCFSGDDNSTALVHLIREGMDDDTPKRIRFIPHLLYIDESSLDEKYHFEEVKKIAIELGFPLYIAQIEESVRPWNNLVNVQIFNESGDIKSDAESQQRSSPSTETFRSIIDSAKSVSAREDLFAQLRREFIRRVARQTGFSKIFLADSGSCLAMRILSDMATGRGGHLRDNVNFHCEHLGVEFYRPMRECFDDEIRYFLDYKNANSPKRYFLDYKNADSLFQSPKSSSQFGSVKRCTEDFVRYLQDHFVSTVPTILKTGAKIDGFNSQPSQYDGENSVDNHCRLCHFPVDRISNEISAAKSILFSKYASSPKILSSEYSDHQNSTSQKVRNEKLCYACSNLHKELGSDVLQGIAVEHTL